jgi:hypothetical protein
MKFYSVEKYISFFTNIKNAPLGLKKGAVPKVEFEFEGSAFWYIFIAIFGFAAFIVLGLILVVVWGFLGIVSLPLIFASYFAFFMTVIVLTQVNYYDIEKKDTHFRRLWKHNMGYLVHLLRVRSLYTRYPKISPYLIKPIQKETETKPHITEKDFVLFIGKSTGLMSQLWHGSALAPDQNVLLDINDASKNILVLGGIGSGKTSSIMQPLLLQLLHQNCGGLIFDIKGDVKNTTLTFAKCTNRHIRILGPSQSNFNLLCGLSPEIASSFLKSSLMLSNGHNLDGFWIDTATELSRNALGLLAFIPKHYTLVDLYRYIFDKDAHKLIEKKLQETRKTLSPKQKRLFDVYHKYKTSIFDSFDEKVKSGVKATLAQTLSPFSHPELADAFCSEGEIEIEGILNGAVFLVDMPIAIWGLGAKVAYTFIKLRFFNLMQKHHNAENRKLPVFFMCDEFQEIVSCNKDGLSDLNFWDKARSSKTIGIISAQSIASIFAATPNRDYAYALLQNFRNKICLASEDPLTIDYISQLTGKAKTKKRSESSGSSGGGSTISEVRDEVLEAQIFRSLSPQSALALLTINNLSSDDALKLYPIFLTKQN